jgi:enoyl-CoA hydratase/long-chain 3-hydroxyacyl-CoA dehydrogenase
VDDGGDGFVPLLASLTLRICHFYETFLDEVGCDISYHVSQFMGKADLGVRMAGGDPEMMKMMVDKGFLGRKTGKGFYLYPKNPKKGEKKQLNPEVVSALQAILKQKGVGKHSLSTEDIQFRIISRFVNEAAFCLQDGIIRAPADGA